MKPGKLFALAVNLVTGSGGDIDVIDLQAQTSIL